MSLVTLGLFAFSGCGGNSVSELVDKAKVEAEAAADKIKEEASQSAAEVKESVTENVNAAATGAQEQLQLAGKMELASGSPLTTNGCYARFIVQTAGRPNVLQLRSYKQIEQEAFPSVLVQGQTTAATPAELIGQTVPVEIFAMREANGAILKTPTGKMAQLKINAFDNQTLSAEIVSGSLESTDAAGEAPLTGTVSAVVEL